MDEMPTNIIDASAELPNSPDSLGFEEKANVLIDKFNVREGMLHPDQVVARANEFVQQFHLPEAFTNDEANVALLLGCSQKLVESSDPLYRSRVENLVKRLIVTSVEKDVIDEEELWGSSSDGGGLDEGAMQEYVKFKTDSEATEAFKKKYAEQINACREAWKEHGYGNLEIDINIVDDDQGQFLRNTRSAAYINSPDSDNLNDPSYSPTVRMVFLKGHSAEKDDLVRHEFYHIEDFFEYMRRGYQSGVFELLDELHTEYAVGNYTEDSGNLPFGNEGYFSAKRFWDQLSFTGDLDFSLLADRQKLISTIVQQFGFEGLADFALVYAHSGGKIRAFETFYDKPDRAILAMLIDKDKMELLKALHQRVTPSDLPKVQDDITRLGAYMTPSSGGWWPGYSSLFDMLPILYEKVYDANTSVIPNEKAKELVNSYTYALAVMELYAQGVPIIPAEVYDALRSVIQSVPFKRKNRDFSVEGHFIEQRKDNQEYFDSEEKLQTSICEGLFYDLVSQIPHLQISFNLSNQEVKVAMGQEFYKQLDDLVMYVQNRPKDMEDFVRGIFGYKMPFELRTNAVEYIARKYPQFKPLLDERKLKFDSRRITNIG